MTRLRHHGIRRVADVATALRDGLTLLDTLSPDGPIEAVWWVPRRSALVLGRGSAVAESDRARARADLDVVRRTSGGGPVLWDETLLALDIAVPRGHDRFVDDVTASYEWIGLLLAQSIDDLGTSAHALTVDEARRTDDATTARLACFAGRSPWEVVVEGRKLVGLSQTRRRHGSLIQVGILDAARPTELPSLLDVPDPVALALQATLDRTTIGLRDLTLDSSTVRSAIDDALASAA